MNDEMATRLAQELLDAADEDARARVVVRWLPDFARCQVTTSARVKQLVAKVDELARKMDAYHAPAQETAVATAEDPRTTKMDAYHAPAQETAVATAEDPRTTRLKLILAFAQRNWPAVALLAILVKVFGLDDLLAALLGFFAGS